MRWTSLGALGRLTAGALIGMAALHLLSTLILEGELPPAALIFEVVLVGLAGLVITGRWWATAVATGMSALMLLATAVGSGSTMADPGDREFISVALS